MAWRGSQSSLRWPVGGLEYTEGASFHTRASMVAAMLTVALLPMVIDMAWRISRFLAMCLVVGFVAFLAYSLPATIGRIGEVKEGMALAASDAAALQAQIEDVRKTLRFAEPDMQRECAGAPDPLPPGVNRWPECRRKRGSVEAFLAQENRLKAEIRSMGSARLGDTSSQTLAWALSIAGVSEETIRKGSGMALAIGLEVVIASLLALASVAMRKGTAVRSRHVVETVEPAGKAVETISETRQPRRDTPDDGGNRKPFSRDEALADLKLLLQAGHSPESQEWLKDRWRLGSKGTVSKWLASWETAGEMPGNRQVEGRCKTIVAA